jgi:hypothetical protein
MVAFNVVAAELFDRLFESFPFPLDIDLSELYDDASRKAGFADDDSEEAQQRDFEGPDLAGNAINWLEQEGYLRVAGRTISDGVYGLELTEKALSRLRGVPASILQKREPLIDRIREAVIEEAPKTVIEKTAGAIGALLAPGVFS